jgi:hypothetical protein
MGAEDYARDKVVILGDEAHHYSASTKSEKETEQSWEKAISTILHANEDMKIKGVKFYTMNDGRGTMRQIGEIALGKSLVCQH